MSLTFWEARFPFLIFCREVYNLLASGVNRLSPDVSMVAIEDTLSLNVEIYPTIKFWYKQQHRKENTRCQKLEQQNSGHNSQDENMQPLKSISLIAPQQ